MLTFYFFITASIGIVALLVGVPLAFVMTEARRGNLSRFRSKSRSAAELFNYETLVDDVVLGKDGSLVAGWIYTGADNANTTADQQQRVALLTNNAFKDLGAGWTVHFHVMRAPASPYLRSQFPDAITQGIEDERVEYFSAKDHAFENYSVMTLSYLRPADLESKGARLLAGDEVASLQIFAETANRLEAELPFNMRRLTRRMFDTGAERVPTHELISFLHTCVTGDTHPIHVPDGVTDCDLLVGGQDYTHGVPPKIGNKTIQVVAVEGFPVHFGRGRCENIALQRGTYRWTTRFVFLDKERSERKLKAERRNWGQKVEKISDKAQAQASKYQDEDALSVEQDATAALTEVSGNHVAGGYYTSVVVIMDADADAARSTAEQLRAIMGNLGLTAARVEETNATEAFLGSLPGHCRENVRQPWMTTQNLAELMPQDTMWTGEAQAPCPAYPVGSPPLMHCVTNGRTPYRLNLHVQDLGNTLIFGPPGAGKSTLLLALMAQFRRYRGARIVAFDKGMSMYPLAAAIRTATDGASGAHYTLSGDDEQLGFAPLQHLESRSDVSWAANWLDTILRLNGLKSSPEQRMKIADALRTLRSTGGTTLTDLCATIQDRQIQQVLHAYTVDGVAGHLLDAEEDAIRESDFTVFELDALQQLDEKYLLPTLLYLFRRVERMPTGEPMMIVLDEASTMWRHPVALEKFTEWLRNMRKKNCIVVMATQSTADASDEEVAQLFREFVDCQFFLANYKATTSRSVASYESFGLNATQIQMIANAKPKQHYFHASSLGQRQIELAMGPFALAFCGASDIDKVARIQELERDLGPDWISAWVNEHSGYACGPQTSKEAEEGRDAA